MGGQGEMFTRKYVKTGIVVALGAVVCVPLWADEGISQIQRLMQEKQQKYAKLEECSKKVEGFKIAGISTLGLTAIGIGANVALVNKQDKLKDQIVTTKKSITNREQQLVKLNEQIADARVEKAKRDAEEAERKRNEQAIEAQRQAACIGPSVRWNYTTKNCECADPLAFWNADKNACERPPVEQKTETQSQSNKPSKTPSGGNSNSAQKECVKNINALLKLEGLPVGTLVVYNGSGNKVEVPSDNTKYYKDLASIAKEYSVSSVSASAQSVACDKFASAKNKVDEIFAEDQCVKSLVGYVDKYGKYMSTFRLPMIDNAKKMVDDGVFSKVEGDVGPCNVLKNVENGIEELKKKASQDKELEKKLIKVGLLAGGAMLHPATAPVATTAVATTAAVAAPAIVTAAVAAPVYGMYEGIKEGDYSVIVNPFKQAEYAISGVSGLLGGGTSSGRAKK